MFVAPILSCSQSTSLDNHEMESFDRMTYTNEAALWLKEYNLEIFVIDLQARSVLRERLKAKWSTKSCRLDGLATV